MNVKIKAKPDEPKKAECKETSSEEPQAPKMKGLSLNSNSTKDRRFGWWWWWWYCNWKHHRSCSHLHDDQ